MSGIRLRLFYFLLFFFYFLLRSHSESDPRHVRSESGLSLTPILFLFA